MIGLKYYHAFRERQFYRMARSRLGACGERVILSRSGSYTWPTLFLGNDVHVGTRTILWAINRSRIVVGDKVLMGPEVIVMSGNHNTSLVGRFMYDFKDDENRPEDDQDVIFENDIWVGARAVILKGVRIGRGAVIGASAVVTKSIPPYSIVAGNPARPIRLRGTIDQILNHERLLYEPTQRIHPDVIRKAAAACVKIR